MSHLAAARNIAKLKKWVKATPLTSVKRNQFGNASRKAICKHLNISLSTTRTNPEIEKVFTKLDARLNARAQAVLAATPRLVQQVTSTHPTLLSDPASEEITKLRRLLYLEETGVWLR